MILYFTEYQTLNSYSGVNRYFIAQYIRRNRLQYCRCAERNFEPQATVCCAIWKYKTRALFRKATNYGSPISFGWSARNNGSSLHFELQILLPYFLSRAISAAFCLSREREIFAQCRYRVGYITWSIIGKVILRAGNISYDASKGGGG